MRCRLQSLSEAVAERSDLSAVRERIGRRLYKTQLLLDGAEARCTTARRAPAKRKLNGVSRHLGKVMRALRTGQDALADTTGLLRNDVRSFARTLTCP